MNIAIIGASGFIGSALTNELLAHSSHRLVLFSHRASKLTFTSQQERRITHVDGSVLQAADIQKALQGCDMAVYLVHLMGEKSQHGTFMDAETVAANNFAAAAVTHNIRRVVYVGGMGDSNQNLTNHLQSRQQTANILRAKVNQLIELRTPMVIGPGGAGYEVLKAIVSASPLFPLPRWARAVTQPITVNDVVRYIVAAMQLPAQDTKDHLSIAIGGPERLSYAQIAQRIAAQRGKRLIIVPLPFVPKAIALRSLRLIAPKNYAATVADMIASAGYTTQPIGRQAVQLMPQVVPEPINNALRSD